DPGPRGQGRARREVCSGLSDAVVASVAAGHAGARSDRAGQASGRGTAASDAEPSICAKTGRSLVPGQLPVGDPVRAGCLGTEPLDLVLLVGVEVALEPEPGRPTFPGQDVGGDPVQEPP